MNQENNFPTPNVMQQRALVGGIEQAGRNTWSIFYLNDGTIWEDNADFRKIYFYQGKQLWRE